jgi:hypothetical protein
MNIKGIEGKVDWQILLKAIGIMCISWAALPIIYYLLLKKEKKEGMEEEENDRKE